MHIFIFNFFVFHPPPMAALHGVGVAAVEVASSRGALLLLIHCLAPAMRRREADKALHAHAEHGEEAGWGVVAERVHEGHLFSVLKLLFTVWITYLVKLKIG